MLGVRGMISHESCHGCVNGHGRDDYDYEHESENVRLDCLYKHQSLAQTALVRLGYVGQVDVTSLLKHGQAQSRVH